MLGDGNDLLSEKGLGKALDLMQELERNTSDEVRKQRHHARVMIKVGVTLQPGNVSERMKLKMKGVTSDVSEGGCQALFPLPCSVGDIYQLTFDQGSFDTTTTFGRCVRCRLIREDAYEAGFSFFRPIKLPGDLMS